MLSRGHQEGTLKKEGFTEKQKERKCKERKEHKKHKKKYIGYMGKMNFTFTKPYFGLCMTWSLKNGLIAPTSMRILLERIKKRSTELIGLDPSYASHSGNTVTLYWLDDDAVDK